MSNKICSIYVDLDGVLCDFEASASKYLNFHNLPAWDSNYWQTYTQEERDRQRWNILYRYPEFWENLSWMKGGFQLWWYVRKYNPHILSHAVDHMESCAPGKMKWLRNRVTCFSTLKDDQIHLVSKRSDKAAFAINSNGETNILIDDHIKNCGEWSDSGGIAIHHRDTSETIRKLKELGF